MNYTYLRNPERLVDALGYSSSSLSVREFGIRLTGRRHERAFMDRLHLQEPESFRDLLVVVGGFLDGLLGNAYTICLELPEDLRAAHDVYYREHYEGPDVRELVELYRHRGKRVAVVGHSWGGHAVVHNVARKTGAAIHLLVTLDPVSRRGTPEKRPVNIRNWLNVYVDYAKARRLQRSNIVARIGGPWQYVSPAHVNKACDPAIDHHRAGTMFRHYALPDFSRLRERMYT